MKSHRIVALARKDLREALSNKMVVLPMIIIPAVVCVVLPVLIIVVALRNDVLLVSGARLIERLLPRYAIPEGFESVTERMLYVFLNYTMLPFFLIIPIMVSSILASHSITGEKERRTLETLLSTPISNRELVFGKLMGAMVPAMAVGFASFILYAISANSVYAVLRSGIVVREAVWIPVVLLLVPGAALLGLSASFSVGLKAKTFMEAQQMSALVVLPCILLVVVQVSGLAVLSAASVSVLGAVLLGLDALLMSRVIPRFDRERVIALL